MLILIIEDNVTDVYKGIHLEDIYRKRDLFKSKGYPYFAVLKYGDSRSDCIGWCRDNLSIGEVTWTGVVFYFKNQEDFVLFTLTWKCLH